MELLKNQNHLDFNHVSGTIRRTPQGGILANSRPTRVGVLTYNYPGGKQLREFRPPEEVFHPDSLSTLAGAPLTVGHPKTNAGLISPQTWKEEACGHVGDDVRQDENFVAVTARVLDAKAVDRVESKELTEMSCGYTADLQMVPGVFEGQRYDAIQRNIRYNHVALLPPGAGRAGPEVGIRLDSAVEDVGTLSGIMAEDIKSVPTTVLDAKDFVAKTEFDTLKGQLAAVNAQLNAAKVKMDEAAVAMSQENIDKRVAARSALVTKATSVVPNKLRSTFKTDGLSDLDVMVQAIKLSGSQVKMDSEDAKSEGFVKGVFSSLSVQEEQVQKSHEVVLDAVKEVGKVEAGVTVSGTKLDAKTDPLCSGWTRPGVHLDTVVLSGWQKIRHDALDAFNKHSNDQTQIIVAQNCRNIPTEKK